MSVVSNTGFVKFMEEFFVGNLALAKLRRMVSGLSTFIKL